MDQNEIETRIKNIDDRTKNIEHILPTLATRQEVHDEGKLTRAHFDAVAEDLQESIKVIAEGHKALGTKIDGLGGEIRKDLTAHDRRIMKLEAESIKRR